MQWTSSFFQVTVVASCNENLSLPKEGQAAQAPLVAHFFDFFLGGKNIHYTYMYMQRKKSQVSNGTKAHWSYILALSFS